MNKYTQIMCLNLPLQDEKYNKNKGVKWGVKNLKERIKDCKFNNN